MHLLMRHGFSTANDKYNRGTPAFGHRDAKLMPSGIQQGHLAELRLLEEYGLTTYETPAAVSTLRRTRETGIAAGFSEMNEYASLDEIDWTGPRELLRPMLDRRETPRQAIERAEKLLAAPPEEQIWITHGLVMLGVCALYGIDRTQEERFVPAFCEIIEI